MFQPEEDLFIPIHIKKLSNFTSQSRTTCTYWYCIIVTISLV